MKHLLDEFKPLFNKPQHRNFQTYVTGLIACEGKNNIKNINEAFTEHAKQVHHRALFEPAEA